MDSDFQRNGGVSEQYDAPRPDWLTGADIAEAEAKRAEYYRDFVARVDAQNEAEHAEYMIRRGGWLWGNETGRSIHADRKTFEEIHGA